jgi:hypothetical protein
MNFILVWTISQHCPKWQKFTTRPSSEKMYQTSNILYRKSETTEQAEAELRQVQKLNLEVHSVIQFILYYPVSSCWPQIGVLYWLGGHRMLIMYGPLYHCSQCQLLILNNCLVPLKQPNPFQLIKQLLSDSECKNNDDDDLVGHTGVIRQRYCLLVLLSLH